MKKETTKKDVVKEVNQKKQIVLSEICEELGIDPKKARKVLREHNMGKETNWRWQWNKKPTEVIKILRKEVI